MTVYEEAPGIYSVSTESGSEYTVDARQLTCDCPDFRYRSETVGTCKHIERCKLTLGVDPDPQLLEQREAMADD